MGFGGFFQSIEKTFFIHLNNLAFKSGLTSWGIG